MKKTNALTTIAAIATPPGKGGVGIVRVSGPQAASIAAEVMGFNPTPRYAHFSPFHDVEQDIIDQGIGLLFTAPHSFTGEDVFEMQGHGGTAVLNRLLNRAYELGAIPAKPGEFSERAYLNGKMDLSQAEALADLINASTEQAARSAMRSLVGDFSQHILSLQTRMVQLRIYVEASIDFPEEEIDFLKEGQVERQIREIAADCDRLLTGAKAGVLLSTGMTVVIAGVPNVGKSSLMNALATQEVSIVTDIPGTTRDVVQLGLHIDGIPLHVMDTAGLRHSDDIVEQLGVARAKSAIASSDLLLWVIDARELDDEQVAPHWSQDMGELPDPAHTVIVLNKCDLISQAPGACRIGPYSAVYLSAKEKMGIDALKDALLASMGVERIGVSAYSARERHIKAIERSQTYVNHGLLQLHQGSGELVAEDLRAAHDALGDVLGKVSADEFLGQIFSQFCIGK